MNTFQQWYNWSAANGRETGNALIEGIARGEQMRARQGRQNALAMLKPTMGPGATVDNPNGVPTMATDPVGARDALLGMGDFEAAGQVNALMRGQQSQQVRAYVQPDISAGRYRDASMKALGAGEEEIATQLGRMDEAQRAQAARMADSFASIGYSLQGVPYEERRSRIAGMKSQLVSQGLSAEQVDGFDPTDDNIGMMISQSIGLKGMLAQRDKDREYQLDRDYRGAQTADMQADNRRADAAYGEDVLHNRNTEANAGGRLALDWQQEGRLSAADARPSGTGQVLAGVYDKIARGAPLTPGEQRLYDDAQRGNEYGGLGGYGGDYDAYPAPPRALGGVAPAPRPVSPPSNIPGPTRPATNAAPAPRPAAGPPRAPQTASRPVTAGTTASPHRPRTVEDAKRLPPGSYFLDGAGQLRQRPAR